MTMSLVQSITVGVGGAASIEFTGIPQTGQDLVVLMSLRSGAGAGWYGASLRLNTVSPTGRFLFGDGSTAASYGFVTPSIAGTNITANTFNSLSWYIPNYTSTVAKSASVDNVGENNATAGYQEIHAMTYATVTAGVTSITITGLTSVVQYSSASLYTISTTGATGATVA